MAAGACCVQMVAVGPFGKAIGQAFVKPGGHTQAQVVVIGFEAQHVVGSCRDDVLGDGLLAAHGVDGEYALDAPDHAAQPLVTGFFQRFGVDQSEHPREGVVRGDAVGQLQETRKPLLLGLAKFDDLGPVVCSSYDGGQRNGQYVQEVMALRVCHGTSPKCSITLWRGGLLMQGDYGLFRYSVVCPLTAYIPSGDSLLGDTNLVAIALPQTQFRCAIDSDTCIFHEG